MDNEEDFFLNESDNGAESDGDFEDESATNTDAEDDDLGIAMGNQEPAAQQQRGKDASEDYPFEVIESERIMQYMIDIIREVTSVIQVSELVRSMSSFLAGFRSHDLSSFFPDTSDYRSNFAEPFQMG